MFSQAPYGRGFGGDPMGLQGGAQMPMQGLGGPPMHMQGDARLGNPMMPLHSQLSPYPAPVLSRPLPPQADAGFNLGGFPGSRPGDGGFGLGGPRPSPALSRPGAGPPAGGMGGGPGGAGMGGGPPRRPRPQGEGGCGGGQRGPGGFGGGGSGGGAAKGGKGGKGGPGGFGGGSGGGGAKGGKGHGGGGGMPQGMPGGADRGVNWTYGQGTGASRTTTKGGKDGGKGYGAKGTPALGGEGGAHSNIFVGNLAEGTTQADLEQNFAPFGTVQSCMVTSKAGRTYGFVKLSTATAAARAIAALNGSSGWLVKFANNDTGGSFGGKGQSFGGKGASWDGGKGGWGGAGKVTHANVFIGSLSEDTTEASLREEFTQYGTIKSCFVRTKGDQTYGFAEFATVSEAEAAIAGVAGKNNWVVKFANYDAWDDDVPHSNVYIGNIAEGTTEATLKQACGQYGTVESCTVKTDSETGKTYGFVKFSTNAAASRAIKALDGHEGWTLKAANNDTMAGGKGWGGKGASAWGEGWVWQPGPSHREDDSRPEGPPSDNLYVKDLPPGITEDEVFATFSKVGPVVDCYVLRWDNLSACAALVRMASMEQATRAKEQLTGTIHENCHAPLSVKPQEKNGEKLNDHVYVKGIHCTTSEDQIRTAFTKYGTVKWCRILPAPYRAASSTVPDVAALVQFSAPEEATAAIEALDGQMSSEFGAPMMVRFAEEKANAKRPAPTPNNNLYVKGWPVGFPEFLLQSEFQKYGNVVRLRLLDNPDPEYPTCAALVQMSRVEEATMAVTALHGRPLQVPLPPMRVKFAGKDQTANSNLYVTSLPRTMTEGQIRQTFGKFGEIVRLKLLTQQGKPETHALVELASPEAATAAIRELDGSTPEFKGPMLNVTYAMKREMTR